MLSSALIDRAIDRCQGASQLTFSNTVKLSYLDLFKNIGSHKIQKMSGEPLMKDMNGCSLDELRISIFCPWNF